MTSTYTSAAHIPAVCRLADAQTRQTKGTAFLIGPGLLLSSTKAVTLTSASSTVAIFFENTKKSPIVVKLQPTKYYFESKYPEHMDYCVISCEGEMLHSVTPIELPLVRKKWPPVSEGDMVLVVQHIIQNTNSYKTASVASPAPGASSSTVDTEEAVPPTATSSSQEQKRFEEVLRCRNDVFFLKATGSLHTAGCPVFNDNGQLVGLQCQYRSEAEGYLNRVLTLPAIVRHLFANSQLANFPQNATFDDVWDTWFVEKDVSRIVSIMANFKSEEMVRSAAQRLCDLTVVQTLIPQIIQCGGIPVVLHNMRLFTDDVQLASLGLRALWNLSIGNDDHLQQIVEEDGTSVIIVAMENFPQEEMVLEFGAVLLYNIYGIPSAPDFLQNYGERILVVLKRALSEFVDVVVLQKFSFLLLTLLLGVNERYAINLMQDNIMQHVALLIERKHKQVFLMEVVIRFVARLAEDREAVRLYCSSVQTMGYPITKVIDLIVLLMLEYKQNDTILVNGNKALWGFGNEVNMRVIILQNPRTQEALQISLPALMSGSRRL